MNANEMLLCTNNLSTDEFLEVALLSYTLYVHRRYKFVIILSSFCSVSSYICSSCSICVSSNKFVTVNVQMKSKQVQSKSEEKVPRMFN